MTVASMLMQYNVDNTFVVKNQKLWTGYDR
jgi:hypothetical protein